MHAERITFLIYCTEQPSPALDIRIQTIIGHLWYARMWKAAIIVPDHYTSLLVVKEADRHHIPVRVVGANKNPRCGVRPYQRVIDDHNRFMVEASDECFLIGMNAKPLSTLAQGLGKQVYELC